VKLEFSQGSLYFQQFHLKPINTIALVVCKFCVCSDQSAERLLLIVFNTFWCWYICDQFFAPLLFSLLMFYLNYSRFLCFAGVLSECVSLDSQQHNVKCVVDTLADEYLHVDLSHISPQYFISGDPTTVYNLLEILDGLLDFMLDQISNDLDSGGALS